MVHVNSNNFVPQLWFSVLVIRLLEINLFYFIFFIWLNRINASNHIVNDVSNLINLRIYSCVLFVAGILWHTSHGIHFSMYSNDCCQKCFVIFSIVSVVFSITLTAVLISPHWRLASNAEKYEYNIANTDSTIDRSVAANSTYFSMADP